ncbi:MAG: hypothetical protein K8T90_00830, partial [Planctomycetes bacterium]|nr:hypothetical protein [Planctomycetota bacterium]
MPKSGPIAAALLSLCAGLTACASAVELGGASPAPESMLRAPLRGRLVAQAVLSDARGALEATAHVALSDTAVRVHLGTSSGLTIFDIEVRGAETAVRSESEFGRMPGLRERVASDLRRLFGDRSAFGADAASAVVRDVVGPAAAPRRVALRLADGSWAVADADELAARATSLRVTLLGADLREEAAVTYDDISDDGFPRSLRLDDLADGHRIELDVVQV